MKAVSDSVLNMHHSVGRAVVSSPSSNKIQTQIKVGNQVVNLNLTPEQKQKLEHHFSSMTPEQRQSFLRQQQQQLVLKRQQLKINQTSNSNQQILRVKPPVIAPKITTTTASNVTALNTVQTVGIKIEPQTATRETTSSTTTAATTNLLPLPRLKRTITGQLTKEGLIAQQIWRDQSKVVHPDCKNPFRNVKDAMGRLLSYHVYHVKEPHPKVLKKADDSFEEYAQSLLDKAHLLKQKYQHLLMVDSVRPAPTSELTMMEKMFIAAEKVELLEDKKLLLEKRDEFTSVTANAVNIKQEQSSSVTTISSIPVPVSTSIPAKTAIIKNVKVFTTNSDQGAAAAGVKHVLKNDSDDEVTFNDDEPLPKLIKCERTEEENEEVLSSASKLRNNCYHHRQIPRNNDSSHSNNRSSVTLSVQEAHDSIASLFDSQSPLAVEGATEPSIDLDEFSTDDLQSEANAAIEGLLSTTCRRQNSTDNFDYDDVVVMATDNNTDYRMESYRADVSPSPSNDNDDELALTDFNNTNTVDTPSPVNLGVSPPVDTLGVSPVDTPPPLIERDDRDLPSVVTATTASLYNDINYDLFGDSLNEQMQSAIDSIVSLQQGEIGPAGSRAGTRATSLQTIKQLYASTPQYEDISGEEEGDEEGDEGDETCAAIQSIL
ncbi:uncharacterized protein LOC141912628 [Tubulanus polymorphus]|uniref:uncharacterized protein LOC141912628 n=1 Tax=Tubulanus polymorphus TaxID=672921 RepID=UPI003DA3CD00